MCIRYSSCLLFTKDYTKDYLYGKFKNLDFNMTKLDYSPNVLDKPFLDFLNEHDISPYNYYLLIDGSLLLGKTSFVIGQFFVSTTTKDLVILCRKDTNAYKSLTFRYDLSKDSKIKLFNIQRFIHFIPNLTKHCYGYIHSNIFGIDARFLKASFNYDIVNIVFDTPFNQKANLCNALYYNEKNLVDVIYKADKLRLTKSSMA